MAATDETYRNQKTLDVVFGVSCVLLLVTTVLMLWLDHDLAWKHNQRTFRDVVPAIREREMLGNLASGDVVYQKRFALSAARDRLAQGRKLVSARERELNARRKLQTAEVQTVKADYDSLMTYYNIDAEHWGKAREGSHDKERLKTALDAKKARLDQLETKLKEAQAKLDSFNDQYNKEVLRKPLPELKGQGASASPVVSNGTRAGEEGPTVEQLEKTQARAKADLEKITEKFDRFAKATVQTAWRFGDTFRALPVLDAFEAPVKIKQIWLPDLLIEYGTFRDVPRFDRCTTCHLGIDQPTFDRSTLQALGEAADNDEIDRLVLDLHRKNEALADLYRQGDSQTLIGTLGEIEALLGTESAQHTFPGLRTQISYARFLWEQHAKERLNPIQLADHLDTLVRTLDTAQSQVALVRSTTSDAETAKLADRIEAKVNEAQSLVKARSYQVKAVTDAVNAPALQPVAKLQRAGDMLKERAKDGEKLGFDPNDLPTRRLGNSPTVVFWIVFSTGLVLAGAAGWVRQSVKLGAAVGVAALLVSVGSAVVVSRQQQRVYVTRTVKLNEGQVSMFAAHPRLDLFVDSNSPHNAEKFGCTICHAGQGSATDFQLASHVPNDATQQEKWVKEHNWHASHYWDFPMLQKRFVESSCVKCHHQMTDLIRHGSKEEAPKLLRGFNLVKDNGCFGCHEIAGTKSGRPIGPDLRLANPALQYLSAADQEKAHADRENPPGAQRKVGPALRRLAEKTNEDWVRKWVLDPRGYRPDTRMPHFYGLSNNNEEALKGTGQEKFPATEVHAIAYYLFAESKAHLKGQDTYRKALFGGTKDRNAAPNNLTALQTKLLAGALTDREYKDLQEVSRRFGDLATLSATENHAAINDALLTQRQAQEQLQELHKKNAEVQRKPPTEADKTEREWVTSSLEQARAALTSATMTLSREARAVPIAQRIVNDEGREVALPPAPKDKAEAQARGRQLFTERGCLACHANEGTTTPAPGVPAVIGTANHGPELSRIAAKIRPALQEVEARRWLVQWLLNPNIYHPRTRMPVTFLSPAQAADVAEWLLSQEVTDWRPPAPATPTRKDLVQLARVYLIKAPGMTATKRDELFPEEGPLKGFPADEVRTLPRDADERRLTGNITENDIKWYIGRKAIARQGCYGCHDIPGFETAKPIGVGLNDWGKKDPARIAFEDAAIWVQDHFNIVDGRRTRAHVEGRIRELLLRGAQSFSPADLQKFTDLMNTSDQERLAEFIEMKARAEANLSASERREIGELRTQLAIQPRIRELEAKGEKNLEAHERSELAQLKKLKLWDDALGAKAPYESMFYHALEHQMREGFLFNKLLEPRSFDYNRIRPWDDRLRMPQFRFARSRRHANESEAEHHVRLEAEEAEAREAVMTFILGLVAEPMPEKYLYKPSADKVAEIKGREVLERFNCAGCHQVRPGAYEMKQTPATLDMLGKKYAETINGDIYKGDIPFPGHSAWTGTASHAQDRLTLYGVPLKGDPEYTGPPIRPMRLTDALRFTGTDGIARDLPAFTPVDVPGIALLKEVPPYGGTFIDTLVPYLTNKRAERVISRYTGRFTDNENNARGSLPPPLYREGERVQPDWLYRFLLHPEPIRPQSTANGMILRMPKFNMSPEESRALVNYFAAVSKLTNPGAGVTYPYVTTKPNDEYWRRRSEEYTARLAKLKYLPPPKRLVTLQKKKTVTAKEKEELEKLTKAYTEETVKFDGLQRKSNLSAEEKAELAKFTKRAKGSKLEARLEELRPVWGELAKEEVAEAEAAVKAAKKEADWSRKEKTPDLPAKEQALKDLQEKVASLKKGLPKRVKSLEQHWKTNESYPEAAFRVVTSPLVCMTCHSVGKLQNAAEKGPNLEMAAQRLRPEWMEWWIAHPRRMFPYEPVMIQNFPNNPDPVKWTWQELFVGSPREQTIASRDVLLDLRRVTEFLDRRPAAPAAAAGGGK